MSVVDRYRTNWPRVGGVIAMGSAGALALTHRRMSTPQLLSALNLLALPLAFPKKRWLGIAPVLFGFGQAVGHGLIFNRLAKDRYSPGFLASLLLHVPIGIQYLRALRDEGPIESADLRKAGPYTIAFAASSIAAPNVLLRDKNSPYRFTPNGHGEWWRRVNCGQMVKPRASEHRAPSRSTLD